MNILMQTVHDCRIYTLDIVCGDGYPKKAPTVRFLTCINMSCVGRNGEIDAKHFPALKNWTSSSTLETLLTDIRREMAQSHNRKLPQPPEGVMY